jgi:plasmid stabilization system protein ParE
VADQHGEAIAGVAKFITSCQQSSARRTRSVKTEFREYEVTLAGLRIWRVDGFPDHLIFYRPIEGGIEIIRILPAARDIDAVLESERMQ